MIKPPGQTFSGRILKVDDSVFVTVQQFQIKQVTRRISRDEVLNADELLLSSATKEVLAVTSLDGKPVGTGATRGVPGPVYARLHAGYQKAKQTATAWDAA